MQKLIIIFILVLTNNYLFPHCQIPCGIYNDAHRIIQIEENLATIEKAMNKIIVLSNQNTPQSIQQTIRWTSTKEDHSIKTHSILSDYFLSQRIKHKNDNYTKQLIYLHKLYVSIMKCKQTVEIKNITEARESLLYFCELYFDAHGMEHLKKLGYLK